MKKMNRYVLVSLAPLLLSCLLPAQGIAGTQAEYQALQQWCLGRDKWTAEGRHYDYPNPEHYLHFHHYCAAMNAMNRLYSTVESKQQQYQAGLVVGETGYVISHAAESHPLMSEVYALRGKALALIKQTGKAESSLMKALQLDPGHIGAYATLGNLYLDTRRKAKAIETAKAGLAVDPQSKPLRRLASKLAIKLEEIKSGEARAESAAPQDHPGAAGDKSRKDASKSQAEPAPSAAVPPSASSSVSSEKQVIETPTRLEEKSADRESTPAKVGSSKNPWCRFCPEPNEQSAPPAQKPSMPEAIPKAER